MSSDSTIDTKLSFQEKPINYTKVSLVVGTYLATLTTIHIYELNAWWKGFRKPFHFQEDLVYGRSVDKVGHFWSGNILAELLTGSLQWGNVSEEQSIYYGAIGGSVFQLFVEVEDGFSSWGFDRVDAAADILGGFYPVLQYHYPFFRDVTFSASYYPRQLNNPGDIAGQKHIIVDDYEGQTFWLDIKSKKLFSLTEKSIFPSFTIKDVTSV
mgnify:FL=1